MAGLLARRASWFVVGFVAVGLALWFSQIITAGTATVTISWATGSEINTAGFNVYRSDTPDGPFSRVNDHLVPASPDPLIGGSYVFTDTRVVAGRTYYYQLEDVETGSATARHGPIVVKAGGDGSVRALVAALVGVLAGLVVSVRRKQ